MKKKAAKTTKAKLKKKPAVKAKAKTAKKGSIKATSKNAKAAKKAKPVKRATTKKKTAVKSRSASATKSVSRAMKIKAEKAKADTLSNRDLQTASGVSQNQPNPAKGPKLSDPRGKESVSSQAVEPTINDPSVPQNSPIPETITEGVAPHGIPYKPEYTSKHAMNEKAETANGQRHPRGTSTHTFHSPGHSRDSSGRK